jgi:pentatricopeptide repeat protein
VTSGYPGISLCMIVRDESFYIEEMLSSVRPHVDEIIVVDTGSVDNTVDLCRPFVDHLLHFDWIEDFAAARNFSLASATKPWILVLDADEMISPEDFARMRETTLSLEKDRVGLIQRQYSDNVQGTSGNWKPADKNDPFRKHFCGYWENPIIRLFRNDERIRFFGRVHEIIDDSVDSASISWSDIPIHHYHGEDPENDADQHQIRNLRILEQALQDKPSARDYYHTGKTLLTLGQNIENAVLYLNQAMKLGANVPQTLAALGEALYRLGRLEEAVETYQRLRALELAESASLNNLANCLVKLGNISEAAMVLRELLRLGIDNPVRRERLEQNLKILETELQK